MKPSNTLLQMGFAHAEEIPNDEDPTHDVLIPGVASKLTLARHLTDLRRKGKVWKKGPILRQRKPERIFEEPRGLEKSIHVPPPANGDYIDDMEVQIIWQMLERIIKNDTIIPIFINRKKNQKTKSSKSRVQQEPQRINQNQEKAFQDFIYTALHKMRDYFDYKEVKDDATTKKPVLLNEPAIQSKSSERVLKFVDNYENSHQREVPTPSHTFKPDIAGEEYVMYPRSYEMTTDFLTEPPITTVPSTYSPVKKTASPEVNRQKLETRTNEEDGDIDYDELVESKHNLGNYSTSQKKKVLIPHVYNYYQPSDLDVESDQKEKRDVDRKMRRWRTIVINRDRRSLAPAVRVLKIYNYLRPGRRVAQKDKRETDRKLRRWRTIVINRNRRSLESNMGVVKISMKFFGNPKNLSKYFLLENPNYLIRELPYVNGTRGYQDDFQSPDAFMDAQQLENAEDYQDDDAKQYAKGYAKVRYAERDFASRERQQDGNLLDKIGEGLISLPQYQDNKEVQRELEDQGNITAEILDNRLHKEESKHWLKADDKFLFQNFTLANPLILINPEIRIHKRPEMKAFQNNLTTTYSIRTFLKDPRNQLKENTSNMSRPPEFIFHVNPSLSLRTLIQDPRQNGPYEADRTNQILGSYQPSPLTQQPSTVTTKPFENLEYFVRARRSLEYPMKDSDSVRDFLSDPRQKDERVTFEDTKQAQRIQPKPAYQQTSTDLGLVHHVKVTTPPPRFWKSESIRNFLNDSKNHLSGVSLDMKNFLQDFRSQNPNLWHQLNFNEKSQKSRTKIQSQKQHVDRPVSCVSSKCLVNDTSRRFSDVRGRLSSGSVRNLGSISQPSSAESSSEFLEPKAVDTNRLLSKLTNTLSHLVHHEYLNDDRRNLYIKSVNICKAHDCIPKRETDSEIQLVKLPTKIQKNESVSDAELAKYQSLLRPIENIAENDTKVEDDLFNSDEDIVLDLDETIEDKEILSDMNEDSQLEAETVTEKPKGKKKSKVSVAKKEPKDEENPKKKKNERLKRPKSTNIRKKPEKAKKEKRPSARKTTTADYFLDPEDLPLEFEDTNDKSSINMPATKRPQKAPKKTITTTTTKKKPLSHETKTESVSFESKEDIELLSHRGKKKPDAMLGSPVQYETHGGSESRRWGKTSTSSLALDQNSFYDTKNFWEEPLEEMEIPGQSLSYLPIDLNKTDENWEKPDEEYDFKEDMKIFEKPKKEPSREGVDKISFHYPWSETDEELTVPSHGSSSRFKSVKKYSKDRKSDDTSRMLIRREHSSKNVDVQTAQLGDLAESDLKQSYEDDDDDDKEEEDEEQSKMSLHKVLSGIFQQNDGGYNEREVRRVGFSKRFNTLKNTFSSIEKLQSNSKVEDNIQEFLTGDTTPPTQTDRPKLNLKNLHNFFTQLIKNRESELSHQEDNPEDDPEFIAKIIKPRLSNSTQEFWIVLKNVRSGDFLLFKPFPGKYRDDAFDILKQIMMKSNHNGFNRREIILKLEEINNILSPMNSSVEGPSLPQKPLSHANSRFSHKSFNKIL